ncbi:50S ribosomal protein L21 [Patescibacteria group bacterium]|nr:50S ribosomal protein L21 [Patescibacteria group bacterium]MDQ5919749.1 large subunit ribosomal protein [Patescibacteria group bacterium]
MIAVIKTGGKQYVVKEGDVLTVEKLAKNPGEQVSFEVLMTAEGADVNVSPKATVSAEVMEQGRAAKVSVVKYKAKSRYTRRVGHRQPFTKVKIAKIA